MDLYEQPMVLMGLQGDKKPGIEAEAFFENADDIINEEDCEESVMLAASKHEQSVQQSVRQTTVQQKNS